VTSRTELSQVASEKTGMLVRAAGSFDCPGNRLLHTAWELSTSSAELDNTTPPAISIAKQNVSRTLHTW